MISRFKHIVKPSRVWAGEAHHILARWFHVWWTIKQVERALDMMELSHIFPDFSTWKKNLALLNLV
jgi:hypothetical protein